MRIGCVREIMKGELRVGLCPSNLGVNELLHSSANTVLVEKSAGEKSGFSDKEYRDSGALILSRKKVWRDSDLVLKVKQPLKEEFEHLRERQMLLCFLHLADNIPLLDTLLEKRITGIAYETIQLENGVTPILAAMSKIAGRIAYFDGAALLKKYRDMLIGPESKILILGLGNAGRTAAELVVATNPKFLYLLDKNPGVFENFRTRFSQNLSPHQLWFMEYDQDNPINQNQLSAIIKDVDLLIAASHVPGELQGKLISEEMVKSMKPGSVIIDISIDQGGALETSQHHEEPSKQIFKKHGVWHYCVPNMPGKVPADSTPALTRSTFPYILEISEKGFARAILENPALARGVNTYKGWITHAGLATSIGREKDYKPLSEILSPPSPQCYGEAREL